MDIHWYDWITPTNSLSALILAACVMGVVALMVWLENKHNVKQPMMVLGIGIFVIVVVIMILSMTEFYNA